MDTNKGKQDGNHDGLPHVIVVGGGFGGLAAVRKLRRAPVRITLIDKHPFNIFQPLLYQVATAGLNPGDITWFLRSVRSKQKNVNFLLAEVMGVDPSADTVTLKDGQVLSYDYLVLAQGATANFFGVPGAQEYAIPLYKRSEALRIRDSLFTSLETAAKAGLEEDLQIVVVGGGATGVETAGALAEMRNIDLPVAYPNIDPEKVQITLVEMSPHVLGPFKAPLRDYSAEQLVKRGVDLRLETQVAEVMEDSVRLRHGDEEEILPAALVIWASGITGYSHTEDWDLPLGRGRRLEVDDHMRVQGTNNIFAVGDAAVNPDDPLPQLAQPAIQAGSYVGREIKELAQGKPARKSFRYVDKGTMATIGRASAIAEIAHLPSLKGFPAWLIWVDVHIASLLGGRNRLATMVNLGQKYIWARSHNLIVGQVDLDDVNEAVYEDEAFGITEPDDTGADAGPDTDAAATEAAEPVDVEEILVEEVLEEA